jgi:hypothetical protein
MIIILVLIQFVHVCVSFCNLITITLQILIYKAICYVRMCIIYRYISILVSNTAVLIDLLELNGTAPVCITIQEQPQNRIYVGNSISKLQIQVATYVFELSAGNYHH